jgi:hypothetical protein
MTNGVLYSPELADRICEVLATGTRSIATLCKEETDFPSRRVFFSWLRKYPEFMRLYRVAKMQQVEPLVDAMYDIIHAAKTKEELMAARLEVDTIKWQAGKLSQRLYGEKLEVTGDVTVTIAETIRAKRLERLGKQDEQQRFITG